MSSYTENRFGEGERADHEKREGACSGLKNVEDLTRHPP